MEYSHDIVAQSFVNSFLESRISEITSIKSSRNRCYTGFFFLNWFWITWLGIFLSSVAKSPSMNLLPNSEFQPAPVFQALAFRADRWSALLWIWHDTVPPKSTMFGLLLPRTKPTARKSYSHCFGIWLFTGGATKSWGNPLAKVQNSGIKSACVKHIAINSNMGHQLWRKVPRMIASIDCPSLCWLGKPINVQPDFAQLVLLFLLAWSRKERKAHEWPIPGGTLWFCLLLSGRTRPLRSHYLLF